MAKRYHCTQTGRAAGTQTLLTLGLLFTAQLTRFLNLANEIQRGLNLLLQKKWNQCNDIHGYVS